MTASFPVPQTIFIDYQIQKIMSFTADALFLKEIKKEKENRTSVVGFCGKIHAFVLLSGTFCVREKTTSDMAMVLLTQKFGTFSDFRTVNMNILLEIRPPQTIGLRNS
jgi:hypothetical protein